MEDVERLVIVDEAARAVDLGEDVDLVRLADALGVDEPQNFAATWLGVERAVLINADEQLPRRRGRETGRIVYFGGRCENGRLETGRHGHIVDRGGRLGRLLFLCHRREHHLRAEDFEFIEARPFGRRELRRRHLDVPNRCTLGRKFVVMRCVLHGSLGLVHE